MLPLNDSVDIPDLSGEINVLSQRPAFSGTYSRVYRGQHINGLLVAIKVLNVLGGVSPGKMRTKVRRERQLWYLLRHPFILPLLGVAEGNEVFEPYGALISPVCFNRVASKASSDLVQWLRRGDSSQFLSEYGQTTSLHQRVDLWSDVIKGVAYLHSLQPALVHGDLKPKNVLISDYGNAQICDFGLVRIDDADEAKWNTTSYFNGTERYLSYELVVAGESACPTIASDVHALGCIGLEFLFLVQPYGRRRSNRGGVICMDIKAGVPPSEDLAPPKRVDESQLWNVLAGCWDRDPSLRPNSDQLLGLVQLWEARYAPGSRSSSKFSYGLMDAFTSVHDERHPLITNQNDEFVWILGNDCSGIDCNALPPRFIEPDIYHVQWPGLQLDEYVMITKDGSVELPLNDSMLDPPSQAAVKHSLEDNERQIPPTDLSNGVAILKGNPTPQEAPSKKQYQTRIVGKYCRRLSPSRKSRLDRQLPPNSVSTEVVESSAKAVPDPSEALVQDSNRVVPQLPDDGGDYKAVVPRHELGLEACKPRYYTLPDRVAESRSTDGSIEPPLKEQPLTISSDADISKYHEQHIRPAIQNDRVTYEDRIQQTDTMPQEASSKILFPRRIAREFSLRPQLPLPSALVHESSRRETSMKVVPRELLVSSFLPAHNPMFSPSWDQEFNTVPDYLPGNSSDYKADNLRRESLPSSHPPSCYAFVAGRPEPRSTDPKENPSLSSHLAGSSSIADSAKLSERLENDEQRPAAGQTPSLSLDFDPGPVEGMAVNEMEPPRLDHATRRVVIKHRRRTRNREMDLPTLPDHIGPLLKRTVHGRVVGKWTRGPLLRKNGHTKTFLAYEEDLVSIFVIKHRRIRGAEISAITSSSAAENEMNILGHLNHHNVLNFFDRHADETHVSLFMDHMPAGSLEDVYLASGRPFSEERVRTYAHQIADGLGYIHEAGVVHRNIKGSSIFLDHEGGCKIADFDFAMRRRRREVPWRWEDWKGTPPELPQESFFWRAPETFSSSDPSIICDPAVDIWSFGCVLLEMLTADRPWLAKTEAELSDLLRREKEAGLELFLQSVYSPEFRALYSPCLRMSPEARPAARDLLLPPVEPFT